MTRRDHPKQYAPNSSSSGLARSQTTMRGATASGSRNNLPSVHTVKQDRSNNGLHISPTTGLPTTSTFFSDSPDTSPRDQGTGTFRNYRQEMGGLEVSGKVPSISRDSPSTGTTISEITPWPTEVPSLPYLPSGILNGSFFDDTQERGQISPSLRPGTGYTGASESPDHTLSGDDRRPSIASATTVSSQGSTQRLSGSKQSNRKRLAGFFYEEPPRDTQRDSDASLPGRTLSREDSIHAKEKRSSSIHTNSYEGPPISPTNSRPRTPPPSSEVTPWLFQDFKEIEQYGDAPVRRGTTVPDNQRYKEAEQSSNALSYHHHLPRLHFPGHRHTRSKEEAPKVPAADAINRYPVRPATSRAESSSSLRQLKDHTVSSASSQVPQLYAGQTSPTPSANSTMSRNSPPVDGSIGKRSIFNKILRHGKERGQTDSLKSLPGSTNSLQDPFAKNNKAGKSDYTSQRVRTASVATFDSGATVRASDQSDTNSMAPSKKEGGSKILHSHAKFPRPRRGFSYDATNGKETDKARNGSVAAENESLWSLDTDLSHMEGIISQPPVSPGPGGIFVGAPSREEPPQAALDTDKNTGPGAWDAPDSWAVKRVEDENMGRLLEIDETGVPAKAEDDGTPHCVRVFRIDSTFATLSTNVNTTVAEILQILGKKSFLQDELGNYQIIMRKHELQRQLGFGERPIAIQKRLLEQAGYEAADRIDEIGREDNSYLCRFTFVPTKLSGFYSLEKEPGLGKMQKFSHVDLSGRSLVTIPITLYQKATEIVSLNLSRNLSLDVPKDFIQGCVNLREVKLISNEAWQLPSSLSLASKLQVLDISNNRLEQLEHAELEKLENLISIKMSNNKLTHLPSHFGQYKALRSLNLSSNYLETFPDFLCGLQSLVDLDISFNSITALPKIGQLVTLERLWATNNRLMGAFEDDFKALRNLKEVDVRFNGISNIDVIAQLPRLEQLMIGHNAISVFEGSFATIRTLHLDHNPITRFDIKSPIPSMTSLNIASAKLSQLDDPMYEKMPNLIKLTLDKNHFTSISVQVGKLRKLEYLSIAKNPLNSLPATIGCLQELRFLDVRECNLKKLPVEIWCCLSLDTLNVSSNVLESFPKFTANIQAPQSEPSVNGNQGSVGMHSNQTASASYEDLGKLEDFGHRRPSQASGGLLSVGSSPAGSMRKGSIVSVYGLGGRKASVISRSPGDAVPPPLIRKESHNVVRLQTTFAGSLRNLYLADNRLTDDVFDEITQLPELRLLNLSYNELYDIPSRSLRRWRNLSELYLSGNELTSLPSDDLEEISSLKVLHLNGNKFQVLPAELGKVQKLALLDVGSNSLKYNVSNWPYDWNWNWNRNLKYLNFSGNKRLEIKPNLSFAVNGGRDGTDLTNFNTLHNLRVLGLMDVTLTIPHVPDETEDRRVRTSGSLAGTMNYGMADSLGKHEHLSTIDMLVPKFRGHDTETLVGIFDGQALSTGGSKIAKYLHENFKFQFSEELIKLKPQTESPCDALRRTFLSLNKELATAATQTLDEKEHHLPNPSRRGSIATKTLSQDDLNSGGVATVMFFDNAELYIANAGDAQAMLMHSDGNFRILTRNHHPADPRERERIREAGGYVSRHGKLNDTLDVSRAFGYVQMMPSVMAAPSISQITLKEQDEMVLVASRELWDYLTPDFVADVARSERGDLMRAAQKLRDLAMAFGATGKIMVMIVGVSDLKKRERNRFRGNTLSLSSSLQNDQILSSKRIKRQRDGVDDSALGRLDPEVEAPTGDLAMVFTDIKNSTHLWETYPVAMRAAIKIHNNVMRRQLRIIGGYEVKTEGDAFMVSFPTVTSALLWCFSVQSALMEAPWPKEILSCVHGQEVLDSDQNIIFRGLSVRMGIHWGYPVCEPDPVTRRMDYFGPMVNRAARIAAEADGGQITVSSEYIGEIQRTLEAYAESDRSSSTGSEDAMNDDALGEAIRRELRQLSGIGFEVKDLGEKKLKGLENPEFVFLMYPHSLAGRLTAQQQRADAEAATASAAPASCAKDSQLTVNVQVVWDLWVVCLRLEMLCSALENPGVKVLKPPETSVMEQMKNRGGEVSDRFLVNFVDHQISRIETCITTLAIRNMIQPFRAGHNLLDQACPVGDILTELSTQLTELRAFKEQHGPTLQSTA